MVDKETLTLNELEQLSQAYMDCRLSLLQEKELELILLSCDISSPVIDEVRNIMGLTTQMTTFKTYDNIRRKNAKIQLLNYTGIAAAIAVIAVCTTGFFKISQNIKETPEIYVCVDGKAITGYVAQSIVSKTEEESMNLFRSAIENAQKEQYLSRQYINSIIE